MADNSQDNSLRSAFSPHCGTIVPKSTFYRHRAKYFDHITDSWLVIHDDDDENDLPRDQLQLGQNGQLYDDDGKFITCM